MKQKKFNAQAAEFDYVTGNMSYRELAKKYGVNQATISKKGKSLKWVQKREHYRATVKQEAIERRQENESNKLANLKSTTDEAIAVVRDFINEFKEENDGDKKYQQFKDCITSFKILTSIFLELNSDKDKDEESEFGVVYLPKVAEEETENVVIEGETDG